MALPTPARLFTLWRSGPFSTLWKIVGSHFRDPRLRQLFARYATYCGSSPFLAPATLMLIAHVEQLGVWSVRGGMQRLAETLAARVRSCGGSLEFGSEVRRIRVEHGRVHSLELADGRSEGFDVVIANTEPWAVAAGYLGEDVRSACGAPTSPNPSLSAVTWTCRARIEGWPLARHNVFFSDDYPAEFNSLQTGRYPADPTIYLCAQDRPTPEDAPASASERVFMLMNAPARAAPAPAPAALEGVAMRRLARAGITLTPEPETLVRTTPADFAARFPGSGGALYGMATHGWRAAFARRGARTSVRGFYLAGGGVHPGAGVPMAALSGRYAASQALFDLGQSSSVSATSPRIRQAVTAP
jgi:1-hydroxycarotenoid 3,4-desaturase